MVVVGQRQLGAHFSCNFVQYVTISDALVPSSVLAPSSDARSP